VSLIVAALLAARVQVGLERVDADKGAPLLGKRVGLVVHAASVTAAGRHAIDVLKASGIDVRRLLTPEHGLRSRAAAGEKVTGGVDDASGLPVVSLYGERTKPDPRDLEGLDVLVFDLQDAGARFYTYMSTMILCLEAAADAGIEFVVLDRPNPHGGERVEGPVSDPRDVIARSLVNTTPGPLVHGLTTGEMARFVNATLPKPARLTVVAMKGWRRSMTWADTGRAWPIPSPNLRTPEAAISYPGTCLIEGTNVTEGRGSDAPFLLVGAPWLHPAKIQAAVRVPGFGLVPTAFTPHASEAALQPKHDGVLCQGLRVELRDAHRAEPYRLGVALLRALKDLEPDFAWRGDGSGFDRLVGTKRLRAAINRGDSVEAIVASDAAAIADWKRSRKSALLY
jgi:uncharacterized protein YbbC (DUF1343 family)